LRRALVAVWAFVSLAAAAHAGPERSFDYIHVEADSGASSGGHAAIRFGDEVFHFQQADPGIVNAVREPFEYFDYVYRAVGNRGLDVTRVTVPGPAYAALREAFERRHLTEDAHLDALASARRDRILLEHLVSVSRPGAATRAADLSDLRLRATGYFFGNEATLREPGADAAKLVEGVGPVSVAPDNSGGDAQLVDALRASAREALTSLRSDVAGAHGTEYLVRRAAEIDAEIARLRFDCRPAPELAASKVADAGPAFADEYTQLLLGRLAVEVLLVGREPVTRAFRVMAAEDRVLDAAELDVLRARAADAARDVVRLLGSRRPEWGFAVLVELARLVAVGASVRLERIVVPDIYPRDAHVVSVEPLAARPHLAPAVLDERRLDFETARVASFRSGTGDEAAWSRMELSANLLLELRDGLRSSAGVRIHDDVPLPVRGAPFDRAWPLPALDPASAASAVACARQREAELRQRLRALYGYNLVTRNCVTEIFDTIDSAPGTDLGARVDGRRGLNFVPFVSAAAVNRSYRVAERAHLPSYRQYWLAECEARGCGIATRLRETNTLTSALYQPGDRQDVFLFFGDTYRPLRPLAGAANLAVGTGATLAGLFTLPFDRGALMKAGARSAAFSVPELAFLSIRKGSNQLVPRRWTHASPFDADAAARRGERRHEPHSRARAASTSDVARLDPAQ
jgi:hypothetical protein